MITEVEIINDAASKEFSPKVAKTVEASGGKYLTRGGQIIAQDRPNCDIGQHLMLQ